MKRINNEITTKSNYDALILVNDIYNQSNNIHKQNKGGRPALYNKPEELEKQIANYFQFCLENNYRPLISSLSIYLGFADKQSLQDYSNRSDQFSFIIKKAKSLIESIYENGLFNPQTVSGSIFALKQFGWYDNQKIDLGLENLIKAPKLQEDEIKAIAEGIKKAL